MRTLPLLLCIVAGLGTNTAHAADLKPETVAAFEQYVQATEARMHGDLLLNHFLVVDVLPEPHRDEVYRQLRDGQIYIQQRSLGDRKPVHA